MSDHKPRIKQYIVFEKQSKYGDREASWEEDASARVRKELSKWQSQFIRSGLGGYDEDCLPNCVIVMEGDYVGMFFHAGLDCLPDCWTPERVWVWKSKECRLEEYLSLDPGQVWTDDLGTVLIESEVRRFSLSRVLARRSL